MPALISGLRLMFASPVQRKSPARAGLYVRRAAVSLAAQRVLDAADGIPHLAGDLIRLAFTFQLGVAGHLAGDFLHLAFGLLERAFHAILVHRSSPLFGSDETRLCSVEGSGN